MFLPAPLRVVAPQFPGSWGAKDEASSYPRSWIFNHQRLTTPKEPQTAPSGHPPTILPRSSGGGAESPRRRGSWTAHITQSPKLPQDPSVTPKTACHLPRPPEADRGEGQNSGCHDSPSSAQSCLACGSPHDARSCRCCAPAGHPVRFPPPSGCHAYARRRRGLGMMVVRWSPVPLQPQAKGLLTGLPSPRRCRPRCTSRRGSGRSWRRSVRG